MHDVKELEMTITKLKGTIREKRAKVSDATKDVNFRYLRKRLKRTQRLHSLLTGKKRKKAEGAKPGAAPQVAAAATQPKPAEKK